LTQRGEHTVEVVLAVLKPAEKSEAFGELRLLTELGERGA